MKRYYLGLLLLAFSINTQALVILQYHHVRDTGPASTRISPERFAEHLAYIEKSNFAVLALPEVANLIREGKPLPQNAAVITFDDGYRSIFDVAYPLLKQRQWPFTVFVNSQPHDEQQKSHMSWVELKEISANGASIANHSRSHAHILRRSEQDKKAEHYFEDEIVFTEQRIKQELGYSLKLFAYPYGEYDNAIQILLEQHGYVGFAQQSGAVSGTGNKQEIPRFPFGGIYGDSNDFASKLKSLAFEGLVVAIVDENNKPIVESLLADDVYLPEVKLTLPDDFNGAPLTCFASGQGAIQVQPKGSQLSVKANKKLGSGRSRYNCTSRDESTGRFYWWSTTFVRRGSDGQWQHQ